MKKQRADEQAVLDAQMEERRRRVEEWRRKKEAEQVGGHASGWVGALSRWVGTLRRRVVHWGVVKQAGGRAGGWHVSGWVDVLNRRVGVLRSWHKQEAEQAGGRIKGRWVEV